MKNIIKVCLLGTALLVPSWAADVPNPREATDRQTQKMKRILKAAAERVDSKTLPATAADGSGPQVLVFRDPAEFTIAPKDCPALKFAVTGKGITRLVLSVEKNTEGTFDIDFTQESSGTAMDQQGGNYIYIYANSGRVTGTPAFDATGPSPPFALYGPDTFRLVGIGAAQGYEVVQYFNLKLDADGNVTDLGTAANMAPACDPI